MKKYDGWYMEVFTTSKIVRIHVTGSFWSQEMESRTYPLPVKWAGLVTWFPMSIRSNINHQVQLNTGKIWPNVAWTLPGFNQMSIHTLGVATLTSTDGDEFWATIEKWLELGVQDIPKKESWRILLICGTCVSHNNFLMVPRSLLILNKYLFYEYMEHTFQHQYFQ
ncbi:unnamed protein product [Ranitomeya imitator]|uniref:Uncharacterized protein n=1 Tax=Ranitomeya imitator TaxID=111125 RepID=A0ABN9L5V6_9NEOB|nr:unnamed protein product [Ranitomeya imitator]